jgi:hypothetical protein
VRALRLLALAGHPALLPLLDAALHSGRDIVVDAAVSLLGKARRRTGRQSARGRASRAALSNVARGDGARSFSRPYRPSDSATARCD